MVAFTFGVNLHLPYCTGPCVATHAQQYKFNKIINGFFVFIKKRINAPMVCCV